MTLLCGQKKIYIYSVFIQMKSFGVLMSQKLSSSSQQQSCPSYWEDFIHEPTNMSPSPPIRNLHAVLVLPVIKTLSISQHVPSRSSDKRARSSTSDPQESSSSNSSPSAQPTSYCYCHGRDEGDMVGCDNLTCAHQWFHLCCLGLKTHPTSKKMVLS